jgi:hypothetical protein
VRRSHGVSAPVPDGRQAALEVSSTICLICFDFGITGVAKVVSKFFINGDGGRARRLQARADQGCFLLHLTLTIADGNCLLAY